MSTEYIIYNTTHTVDLISKNGITTARNVIIKITRVQQCLHLKLRDMNDFSFNYTSSIDWVAFEKMKNEQYLEICYEEFHLQLIDLLEQTLSKDMLLRLESNESKCRMVFYEKSKLKALIFLIIDFKLTDQNEIIDEMANSIVELKEINNTVSSQLLNIKAQLQEKEILLNTTITTNHHFNKKFCKDINIIENTFMKTLNDIERHICFKVERLNVRYTKLLKDLDMIKKENKMKENAFIQTLHQLDEIKRDNEIHFKTIGTLKEEINSLSFLKTQADKNFNDLRKSMTSKENEIDSLNKQVIEYRRDLQEATKIIAQKTSTHDEIAKDLVQANTMLVNFNNQYDIMSTEISHLKEVILLKENIIKEQNVQMKKKSEEFNNYKGKYNVEDVNKLNHELIMAKQKIEDLERQNREAAKINGLLTKKLANGDIFDAKNMNWVHPK